MWSGFYPLLFLKITRHDCVIESFSVPLHTVLYIHQRVHSLRLFFTFSEPFFFTALLSRYFIFLHCWAFPLFCPPAVPAKRWLEQWQHGRREHVSLNILEQAWVKKIQFNVFSDEIWTGELNYSPVCSAPSDDNIVPSRPETLNTKRYFCGVGNCQRSTPLSCLCMHKNIKGLSQILKWMILMWH